MSAAPTKMGFEAKLYLNTATYLAPVWSEIKNVRDNDLNLSKGEADLSTRGGGGFMQRRGALIDAAVEFEMIWNKADANFTALRTAFFARTLVDVLCLDDDQATSGSQGLRAEMEVFQFNRVEHLTEGLKAKVALKPAYSDNPPAWYTVP